MCKHEKCAKQPLNKYQVMSCVRRDGDLGDLDK